MILKVTQKLISGSIPLAANGTMNCLNGFTQVRFKTKKYNPRPKPIQNVQYNAMAQTLKAKGYLRAQNPYTPPKNVALLVDKLKESANITTGFGGKKFSLEEKFEFLTLCSTEFNHTVPNSVLHEINTINDVVDFCETPINTYLPLDELTTRELPPNLHIEHNYTRFNPETDKMFGGKSAFPESSTIVTGIRYRKKYPGFVAPKKAIEE